MPGALLAGDYEILLPTRPALKSSFSDAAIPSNTFKQIEFRAGLTHSSVTAVSGAIRRSIDRKRLTALASISGRNFAPKTKTTAWLQVDLDGRIYESV
jgi:hypothetical protein